MQLTFFDSYSAWQKMLPLTYTRPVAEIRVGILKIHEKWQKILGGKATSFRTRAYLNNLFPVPETKSLTILSNVLPTRELIKTFSTIVGNEVVVSRGQLIAGYFNPNEEFIVGSREKIEIENIENINYPWDIFSKNRGEIIKDYELITKDRTSEGLKDEHTKTYGEDIFLEEGTKIKAAVLNAENGPIYLGKGSEIQDGALIRGPFVLGDQSVVNMGAKMRGGTTIGPCSKVGGEISNSVIQGYSNKGHEGYLGNSVLGEWCNLGAGTNNSNLKNNYANVKMWDFENDKFKDTGLQFCGLIMGDHSKCGINTMFNTGTNVGVSANIFGENFLKGLIPSFVWGGASGFLTYQIGKVFETAELVMSRRDKELTKDYKAMLSHIFETTSKYRIWESK
ncbi:MAG: GlmU family protein [Bacteroidota bacterium]